MSENEPHAGEPSEQPRGDEPQEICYPDGRIEHPGVSYERGDIGFRWLLAIVAGACCVLAVLGSLVWRFYWFQERAQEEVKKSAFPLAPGLSAKLPPQPRLEQLDRLTAVESVAADKRLAAKEKALNSYGPTAENGFVHIPIQQAIKVIAGNLPIAKESSQGCAAHSNGLLEAGESNSGRMFRGPLP
jgi:hypothetical protein